jgi:hypothetical protein
MARRSRKRTGSVLTRRQKEEVNQQRLTLNKIVIGLASRRWKKLRSLAKDDKFRDETDKTRRALLIARGHNPQTVAEFFGRFGYPSPRTAAKAREYLKEVGGSALRRTLLNYLEYASRFGVYMKYWPRHHKFRLISIPPRGSKFRVRLVNDHFESITAPLPEEAYMDYFEDEGLTVGQDLQAQIDRGAAKYIEIEDEALSSVFSELEEFGYSPEAITFVLHKAERPYLLCLIGEKVTQPEFRNAGTVVSALNRKHYGRGKGGRPRDRVRETKAEHKLQQPGSVSEKAGDLSKGPNAKDHYSAERYLREVKKRRPE